MMVLPRSFLVLLPLLLVACGSPEADGDSSGDSSEGSSVDPAASAAAVEDMRAAIKSLLASPEHSDETVKVQHILIAFKGAQRSEQTRSKDAAEALAADMFERGKKGEDFTAMMEQYTNDPGEGIYELTKATGFVAGFKNVCWRLQPGMIGVAPFDMAASPFGWHIIKRLK